MTLDRFFFLKQERASVNSKNAAAASLVASPSSLLLSAPSEPNAAVDNAIGGPNVGNEDDNTLVQDIEIPPPMDTLASEKLISNGGGVPSSAAGAASVRYFVILFCCSDDACAAIVREALYCIAARERERRIVLRFFQSF